MRNRKLRSLIFILTAVSFTGCGSAKNDSNNGLVTYQNESNGITFKYPDGWLQNELEREIIIASSKGALEENRFAGAGAVVVFIEEQSTVGSDLEYFIRKDVVQDEMRYLTTIRPDKLEINGREAVGVTFSRPQGELDAIIGVTLIQLEEQQGVIFVQYVYDALAEEALLPQITQLIESIDVVPQQ